MLEVDYQAVSENSLAIDAEEATKQKGWRVEIEPKQKHIRTFKVTRLDTKPWSNISLLLLALLFLGVAAAAGGIFMKFYVAPNIKEFLEYPSSNCTVTSFNTTTKGTVSLKISYVDHQGVTHNTTLAMAEENFNYRHWAEGSVFLCLYNSNFLEPYDTVENEYSKILKLWFLGFFVPVGALLCFSLPTALRVCLVTRGSTICYYPRTLSYFDHREFVISDWGTMGSDLRNFFYMLLLTYYSNENSDTHTIAISAEQQQTNNRRFSPGPSLFVLFKFFFVITPLSFLCLGIYLVRGYEFISYLIGLIIISAGIAVIPLAAYVSHRFSLKKCVTAGELTIMYAVNSTKNTMYGSIFEKEN